MEKLKRRIIVLVLFSLAAILAYADRTNMGVVIVPMGDEFDWSARVKGAVLGAFFIGYICTQVIGGWLADSVFGGEPVLLIGMSLWSIILLLTPSAVNHGGVAGAVASRIALGLAEGVVFPSVHSMLARRMPVTWLNGVSALINTMTLLGGIVALLVSAPLSAHADWTAVFYVMGACGLAWSISWAIWVYVEHYVIAIEADLKPDSKEETKSKEKSKARKTPWKRLITASPVWAFFTCNYCNAWGFWLILNWLPSYFKDQFEVDLEQLGVMSVLPYGVQGIVGLGLGLLGDYIIRRQLINKAWLRSGSQTVAMLGAASLLVALFYTVNSKSASIQAVGFITGAMALNAFSVIGSGMNHFDLAPRYAGFLYGMGNSVSILPGLIGVPLTGWMLESNGGRWEGVFGLAAAHYVAGLIIFLIFGSFTPIVN